MKTLYLPEYKLTPLFNICRNILQQRTEFFCKVAVLMLYVIHAMRLLFAFNNIEEVA